MGKLTIGSSMQDEMHELAEWVPMVKAIADNGVFVVDSGSTDGTIEYLRENGILVIESKIIQEQGYGPARNNLMELTREHFPDSEWLLILDGDERILPKDFHTLTVIKDNLIDEYNVVALPRIDFFDRAMTKSNNDIFIPWQQDYQARMVRVWTEARYVRRLHEQIQNANIYANENNPAICHFHRDTPARKRELVSRLCSKLHSEDTEWGASYPQHPKEKAAFERYQKYGLTENLDVE